MRDSGKVGAFDATVTSRWKDNDPNINNTSQRICGFCHAVRRGSFPLVTAGWCFWCLDMTLYRIKDWDLHFENNKSRERQRCSFCCIPNKQDGLGYGLLLRHENGEALYGAFVAIILICSKQKVRKGYLTHNGLPAECPLSAHALSVKCQFSARTIEKMLEVVSSNEIGWIEAVPAECPPSAHVVPAECPRREGKERIEGKGRLSPTEKISFERELKSIGSELKEKGPPSDYDKDDPVRQRIRTLRDRQLELREKLGVVA